MRYVILLDDDTNALTSVDCLERLYRHFLERGLPVNLAVIPDVSTGATTPAGERERFLSAANGRAQRPGPAVLAAKAATAGEAGFVNDAEEYSTSRPFLRPERAGDSQPGATGASG